MNDPDPVRLGVANVYRAVFIDENAVWPGELAFERIGLGPVAVRPGSGNEMNGGGAAIDSADGVVFGVGQVAVAARGDAQSLGAGKGRVPGGSGVAAKPFLPCAGQAVNAILGETEDRISFAEGKPKVASLIEIQSARAI